MASADVENLKAAYQAANEGDLDALLGLFRPDTVWRGIERGHLWWRRAPS
jgi:ketosteroid isomerase-like protein